MELNVSTQVPSIQRTSHRRRLVPALPRRALFVPGLILVALVSLLYLSQTSDLAGTGYDIADLQAQQQQLQMQNEQLRLQIDQLESLDRVDKEASTRLHMGPPDHVIYVTAPPVALPSPVATTQARVANDAVPPSDGLGRGFAWLRALVP